MKKSLLALAALTAFAGAASAQSSVTIGGIVDLAARSVKNGSLGEVKTLSPEGLQSNRLIIRGVEDLGGGMRASFWLEGALAPDTGGGVANVTPGAAAGGQTWQRRSTVSLSGAFGEIRLGRDYTPTFWNHTSFDLFNTVGVASQTNLHQTGGPAGSGAGTFTRANNTIGYFLPSDLGGIYGQVMVAAGEGVAVTPATTGGTANKYVGGRLGYAAGPINVAGAWGKTYQVSGMRDDLVAWNLAGSYNFGFMTLLGQYHEYKYFGQKSKNAYAGVAVPFGASTFKATYGKAGGFRSADQIGLGYQYDLSKRTAVYANYSRVDNERGSNFTASGSGNAPPATLTGFKSTGYEFGVRHAF
jgi:predicted porin